MICANEITLNRELKRGKNIGITKIEKTKKRGTIGIYILDLCIDINYVEKFFASKGTMGICMLCVNNTICYRNACLNRYLLGRTDH